MRSIPVFGGDKVAGTAPLLSVEKLGVGFDTARGHARVVRDLSFEIGHGETVALVGESGCGKSVTALSLLRLLPEPATSVTGSIRFEGHDLLRLPLREMQGMRGNRISMIFQEPMTSLNPVLTVGAHIVETIRQHRPLSRAEAAAQAVRLLRDVCMPDPERRMAEYPHRLSGGQRQRVMIAAALACEPGLLVADEPTTALDVTVQAQILALLNALQRSRGVSILLITHDLRLVQEHAARVIVMYAGRKVEEAVTADLFARPLHPYTQGLLAATPRAMRQGDHRQRLREIPGSVPEPLAMPPGCAFAPRCPAVHDRCRAAPSPPLFRTTDGAQDVACWLAEPKDAA